MKTIKRRIVVQEPKKATPVQFDKWFEELLKKRRTSFSGTVILIKSKMAGE